MAHSKRPRRSAQSSDKDNPEFEVNALKSRFCAPSPEESVEEEPPLHLFFNSLKPDFSELDANIGIERDQKTTLLKLNRQLYNFLMLAH